jgi:hypothetical protein
MNGDLWDKWMATSLWNAPGQAVHTAAYTANHLLFSHSTVIQASYNIKIERMETNTRPAVQYSILYSSYCYNRTAISYNRALYSLLLSGAPGIQQRATCRSPFWAFSTHWIPLSIELDGLSVKQGAPSMEQSDLSNKHGTVRPVHGTECPVQNTWYSPPYAWNRVPCALNTVCTVHWKQWAD